MDDLCIQAVTITPNPVMAGESIKISVEIYTLFPALDLHPANDVYPGADLFTLYPSKDILPGTDLYPTEGGMIE